MKLALLRKDLHLFRLPLAAGLVLAVVPYLFAIDDVVAGRRQYQSFDRLIPVMVRDADGAWREARLPIQQFAGVLASSALVEAALIGLGLAAVLAAAYGGIAFAAERRDHSAEFLAMLPVSRLRIAAAKSAAATACVLAPALLHAAVIAAWCWAAWPVNAASQGPGMWAWMRDDLYNGLAVVVMLFGVAWMASAFMAKPAVAAVLALEVGVVVVYLALRGAWQADESLSAAVMMGPVDSIEAFINPSGGGSGRLGAAAQSAARVAAVAVGVLALVAGTAAYVRRACT